MSQVTGILKVYVDGVKYRVKDGSLNTGGKTRTVEKGSAVYGFVEEVTESTLDVTLVHMADTDLVQLNTLTNSTLRVETDTGQVYTVQGAWTTEPLELKWGGEVSLKMNGQPAVKE